MITYSDTTATFTPSSPLATNFTWTFTTTALVITPVITLKLNDTGITTSRGFADGSEVTDQKTGLIWRRCAEGMVFSGGTRTGSASTFTHEAALQRVATQASSTGIGWRLPNVKELSSIADKSRSNPAIDAVAFPATPASWFWSASPDVGGAYYVDFYNGFVLYSFSVNSNSVRLVRAGQ